MPFRFQFPLRFRKAENEKIVRDKRIRETSRKIDEVAGAFGQDTLKWLRHWHCLLESGRTRLFIGFPLRYLYHVPRSLVPFLDLHILREVTFHLENTLFQQNF